MSYLISKTHNDILINRIIYEGVSSMLFSPYTPGAGSPPNFLAGRDKEIERSTMALRAFTENYYVRSTIYYGLRGIGKTVLLTKIENSAENLGIIYEHIEMSGDKSFIKEISICIGKILTNINFFETAKKAVNYCRNLLESFRIKWCASNDGSTELEFGIEPTKFSGIANTGNLENDLTELFLSLGKCAKSNNKHVCFFVDELQSLDKNEICALAEAIHRCNQKQLPVIIWAAGLSSLIKKFSEAKTYTERLFEYIDIGSLNDKETFSALVIPAEKFGVFYTNDALKKIYEKTCGYPYFVQEYGDCVWGNVKDHEIDINCVNKSFEKYLSRLDMSFYKARTDKLTNGEITFLQKMAICGTPYQTANIASLMNKKDVSVNRKNLIEKGIIYPASYGNLDFTVPLFDEYIKRKYPETNN